MSVKERLTKFISYKGITKSAFCAKIGVSSGFISSMRKSIQPDKVESIALNYPELNTGWLLTGFGDMLNSQYFVEEKGLPYGINYDKRIEEKSSIAKEGGEENIAGNNVFKNFRIPFYDLEISAGTMNFYHDYPDLPHSNIEVPFISDCDLSMPVVGDSMYPKIKSGDVVMLKEIHDESVILYGEIYLVITEDYRTLKYIRKAPDEDFILLVSENELYDPVQIPKSSILQLFLYKGKFEKSQI